MGRLRVLLCDADDCLFPSERPAYDASADVTNAFLASAGVPRRWTAEELRRRYTGLNFRATLPLLAAQHGVRVSAGDVDRWVAQEAAEVTSHLARSLGPDNAVLEPLARLGGAFRLAVVSSSASRRIDACLEVTGLDPLFAPADRFSAEDSLHHPMSKPAPAIYRHAVRTLGVAAGEALAVEDSETGVRSAVAAGVPVVGLVQFLEEQERADRAEALLAAGACRVLESWGELERLLEDQRPGDGPPSSPDPLSALQKSASVPVRSLP